MSQADILWLPPAVAETMKAETFLDLVRERERYRFALEIIALSCYGSGSRAVEIAKAAMR